MCVHTKMGGSHSTIKSKEGNVFDKELTKMNSLVNSIITKDGKFKDSEYNFLNQSTCDKYSMVLESNLSKHLKIHLHDLSANIYFVPKANDNLHVKNDTVTKSDLCTLISSHYARTLRVLSLVREIYDFENNGDYSMAGIIYRNLDQVEGTYQVSYCALEQEPVTNDAKVDFKQLKGLNSFVNHFLSESEAKVFVDHLGSLLGNFNKRRIAEAICKDTLVSQKEYKAIYDDIPLVISCMKGGGKGKSTAPNHHLLFHVAKDKPIISYDTCFAKQKMIVPFSSKVRTLFRKYREDYSKNVEETNAAIHKLVMYDTRTRTYKLRDLTHDQLASVENHVKRCIIVMFVQSLVNYFKIFNEVKNSKHFIK